MFQPVQQKQSNNTSDKLMQQIAQMLQQEIPPQQIMQQLQKMGVAPQQAQQMIQAVAEQIQQQSGQQQRQQPQQSQQPAEQEQPEMQQGGYYDENPYLSNDYMKMGGYRKMQEGGISTYNGGVERTPTGLNNAFDNNSYNLSKDAINKIATKHNFRTDSNVNLQTDLENYINKNQPSVMGDVNSKYGPTKAGTFADGMLGSRTMYAMSKLNPEIPNPVQQPDPMDGFNGEPIYGTNNHLVARSRYKTPNSPTSPSEMMYVDEMGKIDKSRGMYEIPSDVWSNKYTKGNRHLYTNDGLDQYKIPNNSVAKQTMKMGGFKPIMQQGGFQSVTDYSKASGRNSSFSGRKELALSMGIENYTGNADQNRLLLQKLQEQDSKNRVTTFHNSITNPETGVEEEGSYDDNIQELNILKENRLLDIKKQYDALQHHSSRARTIPIHNPKKPEEVAYTAPYTAPSDSFVNYKKQEMPSYLDYPTTIKDAPAENRYGSFLDFKRAEMPSYLDYPTTIKDGPYREPAQTKSGSFLDFKRPGMPSYFNYPTMIKNSPNTTPVQTKSGSFLDFKTAEMPSYFNYPKKKIEKRR